LYLSQRRTGSNFSVTVLLGINGRSLYWLWLIESREADSDEPVNQQDQRKEREN